MDDILFWFRPIGVQARAPYGLGTPGWREPSGQVGLMGCNEWKYCGLLPTQANFASAELGVIASSAKRAMI